MPLIEEIKYKLSRNLSNVPGWRTNRKIVVIESDDWGSVRMPSLAAYNILASKNIDVAGGDFKRYNLNDTLATKEDLAALFEVLIKYKDINGNPAAFTPISIVANPNFEKIKASGFKEYYYEPFTTTLKKYYGDDSAYLLWKEGIQKNIFKPQFHGREHLNVGEWMRALQSGDTEVLSAFDQNLWGFNNKKILDSHIVFLAAFDLFYPDDLVIQASIIKEGLALFEELFGYKATFFVPPNGPFNNKLAKAAAEGGIKYISASKIQIEPQGFGKNRKVLHWLGKKNEYDQLSITRNCFFEPSKEGKDWVDSCLKDIAIAFLWHKPAIISSHRVNYIGALCPENRRKGLLELGQLLQSIIKNWPDVEFCTSDKLGDIISKSGK